MQGRKFCNNENMKLLNQYAILNIEEGKEIRTHLECGHSEHAEE